MSYEAFWNSTDAAELFTFSIFPELETHENTISVDQYTQVAIFHKQM